MFNIIRYTFLSCIIFVGLFGCTDETYVPDDSASSAKPFIELTGQSEVVNDNVRMKLSWTSDNIDYCFASGAWSGYKSLNGEEIILNPEQNEKYEITCASWLTPPVTDVIHFTESPVDSAESSVDSTGSPVDSAESPVDSTESPVDSAESPVDSTESPMDSTESPVVPPLESTTTEETVDYEDSTELSWLVDGNVDNYVASGEWDSDGLDGSIIRAVDVIPEDLTIPAPQLSFTATPKTMSQNDSATLHWAATNADSCEASGDWAGIKSDTGSATITNLQQMSTFYLSCSGSGGTVTDSVSVTVVINNSGTALLSWNPPIDNSDGTSVTDLAGYRIYYGTDSGSYTETVTINNPGIVNHLVENLSPGPWYFVMTTFNAQNIESSYSTEVSKIIN